MEFSKKSINGLFDNRIQYCIPVYQRAYSWTNDEWSVFLDDIIQQMGKENTYSYGNLLLETISLDDKYEVIDGQQRLTTIVIFMRALYNVLKSNHYSKDELEIIEENFIIRKGRIKIRPVDNDQACFDTVIVEDKTFNATSSSQKNIIEAKKYFEKELEKYDINKLLQIKEIVFNSAINIITMQGKKEASLMFELQNNRGRDLTNMEKLKSYFMYQMYVNSDINSTETNITQIANYFREIYKTVYDIKGIDEDSILMYHCFAYLKTSFNYRNLTDLKNEYLSNDNRVNWIKDFMYELSVTFQNLKKFQNETTKYKKKLFQLNRKESLPPFVYPFIIKGHKYFGNDSNKLDQLYHFLEILVFRYRLISSRADINSRLTEALRNFNGDIEALRVNVKNKFNAEGHWNDQRYKQSLMGWMYDNPVLHYLLWEYEDYIQPKGYAISGATIENEQIEHISPQTPTDPNESIASGYDVDTSNKYSDDFVENYLNCVGNLMLIAGSHNAAIGNKPFKDKLSSYELPPLRQMAQIKDFVQGKIEWKKSQIINRRKSIVEDFAIDRWSFDSIK